MALTSFGDLAQSFKMQRHQVDLRARIATLSEEAATQRTSNLTAHTRGDFRPIASVEHALAQVAAHLTVSEETGRMAEAMQAQLGVMESTGQRIAAQFTSISSDLAPHTARVVGAEAGAAFASTVHALNGRFAGRALFAGQDTGAMALSDPTAMLTDLQASLVGETTAAGVIAKVEEWFAPGGSFETIHYTGSDTALSAFSIGTYDQVRLSARATDEEFRDLLAGFALGALVSSGPVVSDPEQSLALATAARDRIFAATDQVTDLRGNLGAAEERVARARTSLLAEQSALDLARSEMLQTDPYEAASQLQSLQTQLEILYSITARTAQLTLADYVR